MLHQIPSPARDPRTVLLAQPSWRFRKQVSIGAATQTTQTAASTKAPLTVLPAVTRRDAAVQTLRQTGRVVTPVALVAAAVVLTASVDNVIRIAMNLSAI